MVLAAVFQALGLGFFSLGHTLARQVILPLILVLMVLPCGRLELVWWAFVLAEGIAIPIGLVFWRRVKLCVVETVFSRKTGDVIR